MILVNEIKGLMVRNGMKRPDLAKELGITPASLTNKFKKGVFNSDEIEKMINLFNIEDPAKIFFAKKVS